MLEASAQGALALEASRGQQPYDGLANSRFHTLLFGINKLCSGEMPYFGATDPWSAGFVQPELQRLTIALFED